MQAITMQAVLSVVSFSIAGDGEGTRRDRIVGLFIGSQKLRLITCRLGHARQLIVSDVFEHGFDEER